MDSKPDMYAYLEIVEIQVLEIQFRLMYMASTNSEGPFSGDIVRTIYIFKYIHIFKL